MIRIIVPSNENDKLVYFVGFFVSIVCIISNDFSIRKTYSIDGFKMCNINSFSFWSFRSIMSFNHSFTFYVFQLCVCFVFECITLTLWKIIKWNKSVNPSKGSKKRILLLLLLFDKISFADGKYLYGKWTKIDIECILFERLIVCKFELNWKFV